MDHAEVLTRLADASATPSGIARLESDRSADAAALLEHLEHCATCAPEVAAWRRMSAALLDAAPDPVRAPVLARERILAAVVRDGVPRGAQAVAASPSGAAHVAPPVREIPVLPLAVLPPALVAQPHGGRRPGPVRFRWLALAAAAVALIFVAGAVLGTPLGLTPKDRGVAALVAAIQASDRILRLPNHREAVLTRRDGTSAGAVLVDPATGGIVVLSSDLETAGAADYHCYLVRDGNAAMWIGPMHTQDGTSYWAGKVSTVTDLGRTGDIIQVLDGGTTPELTATF